MHCCACLLNVCNMAFSLNPFSIIAENMTVTLHLAQATPAVNLMTWLRQVPAPPCLSFLRRQLDRCAKLFWNHHYNTGVHPMRAWDFVVLCGASTCSSDATASVGSAVLSRSMVSCNLCTSCKDVEDVMSRTMPANWRGRGRITGVS